MKFKWGAALFCLSILVFGVLTPQALYAQEPQTTNAQTAEKTFNAAHFTLDNGMEIVVIPNHRAPVVTHMVWYRVGAADEPEGKSGIAHFLEHLMFKGSDGLAPGEFSEIIRALGGNDNAFTSQDYTAYFQSIAAEHLETVMRMEAGRMRGLTLSEKDFLSEQNVILEERSQRIDNNPPSLLNVKLSEALYRDHPYGDPVIGWRGEMEALSWEDAKGFYDQYYAPNNAILVVSGDVTGEHVLTLAQEIYGTFEQRPVPERKRVKSFDKPAEPFVTVSHPAVRQPTIQRSFIVPSYRQNPLDSLALQVLEEIVGASSTSRLYKALVIDQKLASGAGLSYRGNAWDSAELTIYAQPLPGITHDFLETAMNAELQKIAKEGISEEELKSAISRLQNQAIYARDSLTGPAMIFGYSLITGSRMDDVERWPQNIALVSAKQIQEVAQKYLMPDGAGFKNAATGYLLPAPPPNTEKEEEAAE